ncbi:MAG TPA: NADH-quinone oxidoreductase subunit M [Candidatus Latescibacteria bacterium]|nr:NADH-quinone oxidoreductase subunit M [Candidatus Latescibacterota bacterium]
MALSTLILLPVIAALILGFLPESRKELVRNVALVFALMVFAYSVGMYFQFDPSTPRLQFVENRSWIDAIGARYHLGVDGVSIFLVLLTTLLTPIAILASYAAIGERVRMFNAMLLLLEAGTLGVFLAQDLVLFYVFWEVMLVPMYFIIGIWGSSERLKATFVFVLYTMAGSVLMLVAIVALAIVNAQNVAAALSAPGAYMGYVSFDISSIRTELLTGTQQIWLFAAFFLAFAIKVPLFPLHTWLPLAHTEAPTAGSVILAGVLLKTGGYAIIRFCLGLFPEAAVVYAPYINTLAVVGIVYGALVSLVQEDLKRLVAYSSVSHMGFILLGVFSFTQEGMTGGIVQMVNHGISTGGLFLCVGMLYERSHTRKLEELGGTATAMPLFAGLFLVITLSSAALPGLNGFVGEFLALAGAFSNKATRWFSVVGATGMILAAAYLLWMFQQAMYTTKPGVWVKRTWGDLTVREVLVLLPIVLSAVGIGVYPAPLLKPIAASSQLVLQRMNLRPNGPIHAIPSGVDDLATTSPDLPEASR